MTGRKWDGPRGDDVPLCTETIRGHYCGQRHLTANDTQACAGHVTKDRDSYEPGKERKLLDKPRPCRTPALIGLRVCGKHGAAHPDAREAGKRRDTERKAAEAMQRFGGPIDTTPSEALLDTVKWTAGYVAWLRDKVAGVGEPEHATADEQRAAETKALVQFAKGSGKVEPSAWVELLGTWHDKLVRVCAEAIRAGIEERRVRIAEQQGALVADVIRKILGDLELTPEQATKAGEAVPRHLRLLAS